MICKRYLHSAVIKFKNSTSKCLKKGTNCMLHNYSSYCCYHNGPSMLSDLLMQYKSPYAAKLHVNQHLPFGIFDSYSTSPNTTIGLSLPFQDGNEEQGSKGKVFTENESTFHHQVLEKSSSYSSTIFKSSPDFSDKYMLSEEEFGNLLSTSDWDSKSPYHIAVAFVSFGVCSSHYLNVSIDDHRFNKLVDAFENKCSSFTDDQVMDCLIAIQSWPQSDHVKAGNFLKVWKALDKLCHGRLFDWSHDKILFVMDLWYKIRLIRLNNFTYHGLNKISRRCKE